MRKTFQQKIAMMEQTLSTKNLQWHPLANKKEDSHRVGLSSLWVVCFVPICIGAINCNKVVVVLRQAPRLMNVAFCKLDVC